MKGQELNRFLDAFNTTYATTFGWIFAYEYPGYFVYYKGQWAVYFTPDHSDQGVVDIQINFQESDNYDNPVDGDDVPLIPRTPARLFEIVSKFLTKIDTQPDVLEWKPKA